jgi:hypothetical protein
MGSKRIEHSAESKADDPQIDHRVAIAPERHPQDRDGLIFGLLNGFLENDNICFWEDRSPEENRARMALAEVLRSGEPLTPFFRNQLATLIAPRGKEGAIIKRRIKFEYVDAGNPRSDYKNSMIAEEVYTAAKSSSVNVAVKSVAEKQELGVRRVWEIWHENRDLLEAIHGPLPRPRRPKKAVLKRP